MRREKAVVTGSSQDDNQVVTTSTDSSQGATVTLTSFEDSQLSSAASNRDSNYGTALGLQWDGPLIGSRPGDRTHDLRGR